jgi:glycine cleavage system T protein (aminomethyltransferase)
MSELRKTPLHEVHLESGARMVAFGGWDMPVEYAGLIAEHQAVRQAAGLFDVSHMGEFELAGPGALAFLQRVTANDVAKLAIGQAQYSALPLPSGCPVDDVIVYRRGTERFLVVVNAANVARDWEWLQAQGPTGCSLEDRSEAFALLALQGPRAEVILQGLTSLDLEAIGFYRFAEGTVAGREAIVARTGYTGEDGFELFLAPEAAAPVWRQLIATGGPRGLVPAGLGARDTLRLEARMLLYGNDMDETTSLIEAGLGWIVSFDEKKGDFPGRAVLQQQKTEGAPRKLVGFETTERGIPRHGYPVFLGEQQTGSVTSGSFAPFLQKSIGLAYLPTPRAAVGSELAIGIRGRRVGARVVPTPFYKRPPQKRPR